MRWVEHVAYMGTMIYTMLVWKPKWKKPLGRPRHRLYNLKMYLREMTSGCGLESSGSEQGVMACLQT